MTQAEIAQIVAAVLAAQQNTPTPAKPDKKAAILSAKDKSILSTFSRRGYKDVVLMDRTDKSKPFNVRPYKGWLENGRVVRKGEKSVRGLFHISQTDTVVQAPAKPKEGAKPAVTQKPAVVAGGIDPAAIAAAVAKLKTQQANGSAA